jgi:hypothetical protein
VPGASCAHRGRAGASGSATRRGRSAARGEGEGHAGARKKKGGAGEEEGQGLTAGEDDAAILGGESVVERREREIARRGVEESREVVLGVGDDRRAPPGATAAAA